MHRKHGPQRITNGKSVQAESRQSHSRLMLYHWLLRKGSSRIQCSGDDIAGNARTRDFAFEPAADVFFKPDAVHEVVQGLIQGLAESIVVDACRINKADVVFCKRHRRKRDQFDAVLLGIFPDR